MHKWLFKLLFAHLRFGVDDGAPSVVPPAPPVSPAPRAAEPETFTREYVTELRRENAHYRTKAKEAEEAATKAATEAQETTNKAKTEANQRIIRAELKAVALKAGMVDLDGLKLADLDKVTLNENGEVQGAEELIEALKKSKAYLFGATSSSSTSPPPPPKQAEVKHATKMTDEEYRAAKAAMGLR